MKVAWPDQFKRRLLTAEAKDGEERNLSDRDRKGKKQEVPSMAVRLFP